MDVTLQRSNYGLNGIFGHIIDQNGQELCVTLEHAFRAKGGNYYPAVPEGTYLCKLGLFKLKDLKPRKLYCLMKVPNRTNILIHIGNYNRDSQGCILLGTHIGKNMISGSKKAFDKFMDLQESKDFEIRIYD